MKLDCYKKKCVLKRDKGICKICGLDCIVKDKELLKLNEKDRRELWLTTGFLVTYAKAWNIDHIIPLCKGGTNKSDNLQVLCYWCHLKKTTEDRRSWRSSLKESVNN